MKRLLAYSLSALFFLVLLAQGDLVQAENWPQWRGPNGNFKSDSTNPPVEWSAEKNILWRLPLPGSAGATPCVWGDRIFLTSVDGADLVLMCVSTEGKKLWQRKVSGGDKTIRGDEGNYASPSPCTDGKHVWTFMSNGVLACFDVDGNEKWNFNLQERYGTFDIQFGLSSTPVLDGDLLYVQLIHGTWNKIPSKGLVLALDKLTSKEVWKHLRNTDATEECKHSYASPFLYRKGSMEYLLTHGADYTIAHDLKTGEELWRCGGLNPVRPGANYHATLRFVSSPNVGDGLVVIPTAKNGRVAAVRVDAKGEFDLSADHVAWVYDKTPDVPSPLIHNGVVYLLHDNGAFVGIDGKTGTQLFKERTTSERHRASPVLADGKIYLTSRGGVVTVVKAGRTFEKLAVNKIGEDVSATPVIIGERIYLRSFDALWAIGR